jgi:hypothetical protein
VIEKGGTGNCSDIQLNLPYYELQANCRYLVRFQAKADNRRSVYIGAAAAHAPWKGVGLYEQIELLPEWRMFELEFAATADDYNARIHFDMGQSEIAVELMSLSVRLLPGGEPVEPSLAPIRIEDSPRL